MVMYRNSHFGQVLCVCVWPCAQRTLAPFPLSCFNLINASLYFSNCISRWECDEETPAITCTNAHKAQMESSSLLLSGSASAVFSQKELVWHNFLGMERDNNTQCFTHSGASISAWLWCVDTHDCVNYICARTCCVCVLLIGQDGRLACSSVCKNAG